MKHTLSYKEKKRAFNSLKSPAMASYDLELLKKLCPGHLEIPRFMLNPFRCSDDILFSLLDFATAEEIRLNRTNKDADFGKTDEVRIKEAENHACDAEQRAEELEKALEDEKKKED